MKYTFIFYFLLFVSSQVTAQLNPGEFQNPCISCEALKDLSLPDVIITETETK